MEDQSINEIQMPNRMARVWPRLLLQHQQLHAAIICSRKSHRIPERIVTSNQTKQTKSVKTSDSGGEKSSHESPSSDKKSDKSKLNQSSTSEVEKKTRKHKRESDELDDSRDGDSEQNLLIKNQRNSNAKSCT